MTEPATASTRLARLAARLGVTEGQAYTLGLLTAVAVLLLASLGDLTGRISDALAAPVPPGTTTTTAVVPSDDDIGGPVAEPLSPFSPRDDGAGAPPVTSPPSSPITSPFTPVEPPAEPAPRECAAAGLTTPVGDVARAVDALAGGVVPDGTIVSALALATGCSEADPVILLLAALIEVGQSMPDLDLGFIELPVLPFLEIPAPVVELVQPIRPVLDPVCNTVAVVNLITSQAGPSYQAPFDAVFSVSLFYALATCGQIQAG